MANLFDSVSKVAQNVSENLFNVGGGGGPAVGASESPAVKMGTGGSGVRFDAENAVPGDAYWVPEQQQPQQQYVGQGYGLEEGVAANMASMAERRGEAPSTPTTVAKTPQDAQAQPNQRLSSMTPEQRAHMDSGMGQQEQAGQQQGVPVLDMPTGSMPHQEKRERIGEFDNAVDSGDALANVAQEAAIYRESESGDEEDSDDEASGAIDRARRFQRSMLKSSADKAIEREEAALERSGAEKPWWMSPVDHMIRFSQNLNIRPKDIVDTAKNRAARSFKREGVGNRIYGKMLGYSKLEFDEVGVGVQEIYAAIRQDPTQIERLLVEAGVEEVATLTTMSTSQIAKLFEDNDVWVATFKPPNNQGQDIQRRKIRVLTDQQRGIFLHNIMAAMYTADYDGDDMEISFDPDVAKYAKNPMDYMVDIYGKISLNSDFMPVAKIVGVNGMKTREYVRKVILRDIRNSHYDKKLGKRVRVDMSPLISSIIGLGDTHNQSTDNQAVAYGKVFREARKFADKMTNNKTYSDDIMSKICKAVFDNMQQTKYYNTLTTIGGDIVVLENAYVPKPVTYADAAIYKVIDGIVKGQAPNNFQELKLMLTGFTGNVAKKNAPFRFTADVGKMMKMDERLKVGNNYVLDVDNDEQMEIFFQTTLKYAGSLRMAKEIKKAGRSEFYTQVMRKMVIDEVGFPDDPRYEGNFQKFVEAFVDSYNYHSAVINESNLVFLTNMGIASESNGVVSPIHKNGKNKKGEIVDYTLGDIAEPILSTYGNYSVGRFFNLLTESGLMKQYNRDRYYAGNPNAKKRDRVIEREFDYRFQAGFWITGKYIDFNLKQFRNQNRLLTNVKYPGDKHKDEYTGDTYARTQVQVARERHIGDLDKIRPGSEYKGESTFDTNIEAQFELLLTIADKKNGAMSKFNKATYGLQEGGHKSDEKSTVQYMSHLLVSVRNAMRQGNSVLERGYYAGIGQRKGLPDDARTAMTEVAKKLNGMGWTLRSGDAKGSDQAFQYGAGKKAVYYKASSKDDLSKTAKIKSGTRVDFDTMKEEHRKVALDAVYRLHPNGRNMKDGYTRDLMARNYFQVMGTDGLPNSAFVACYADADSRGTWQAIRIARENGIPVFNAAEYTDLEQWKDDVIAAAAAADKGELRSAAVSPDQSLEVQEALSALIMANPDLFMHFNMDSPATFLESSYGKKMLQYADNPEMLGGIYTSMVFDYRMERINSLSSEFLTLKTTERLEETWNDLLLAKDELAASSSVWHAIIREFEAESTPGLTSYFQSMTRFVETGQKKDLPQQRTKNTKNKDIFYGWDVIRDGDRFWYGHLANENSMAPSLRNHKTLRSVIEDLDIDRETKWNVIIDVVRYWEKDGYIKSYEVGYQLEIGNDSAYSVGGAPNKAALRTHDEFQSSFNRWANRSQAMIRDDIDHARTAFGNFESVLQDTLSALDERPWELVSIDGMMYADAILSVYDKTYAQTEKASQNPWTNSIYAALSYQQCGGYMNDVTRTDDRLLGLTSVDAVTIHDVIHLLANPDEVMTIYGRQGEIGVISRDILLRAELGQLSGDIDSDIWEFLSKEPRIAAAIRRHTACVKQDSDGEGYLGAKESIYETMMPHSFGKRKANPLEHTQYLMRDHPGYAAIISLALPGKNLITRNARSRIRQIEEYLSYQLYAAATATDYGLDQAAEIILEEFGINEKSLRNAMRSDYDTFLESQGLDAYKYAITDKEGNKFLESDRDADQTYAYAKDRIAEYIRELRDPKNGVLLGQYVEKPDVRFLDGADFSGPDAVSAAAFWDTIQELSGAKTSVSTGIEGGETYKFAEWASHIDARDSYASLEALEEIDDSWNGLWTSMTNNDGTPVMLEVIDGRALFNMTFLNAKNKVESKTYYMKPKDDEASFADARADASLHLEEKIDEIVVQVPDGFIVPDRSTDSHGTQVASLFAYLVSKRSNGAETFNLKAKKAGIDGKDSITKKLLGGKHKIDENGQRVNYIDITARLRSIAHRDGMQAAQMELAKMMLRENESIEYKDMTLANYMSLAELMLIEGADGEVYLRSLEMLMSAIKYRIGFRVDQMNDKELTEAVNAIVNDNSENGVGMAIMRSSLEALDGLRVSTVAMQHNAIRQSSSIWARNYDLMSEIGEFARGLGITPLTEEEINQFDSRFSDIVYGDLKKAKSDDPGKVRKSLLSGYNFVHVAGVPIFDTNDEIHVINDGELTVGPSNAIYIDSFAHEVDSDEIMGLFNIGMSLGMTIVVDNRSMDLIPDSMRKDALPLVDEYGNSAEAVLIPCFDMRLNGSEATPYRSRFAMAPVSYTQYVASAEDSVNEFGLGDAEGQALNSLTDRMSMHDGGSIPIKAESLFPNVFKNPKYVNCEFEVGLASGDEIKNLIADGVRCTIDYGVVEGGQGWEQHVKNVDAAIERYRKRWGQADANGILRGMEDCEPGDIVGWAQCAITTVNGWRQYVLAPIIPFPLHGVKRQPASFSVENLGPVNDDRTLFAVDWQNTTSLEDNYVKYFDSSGGANKGMISLSQALQESRTLLDGTSLDVYIAKASTDSRKVGTDRRIKTMITLMTLARMHGYNFARKNDGTPNEDAFPDNPELRERLLHERIPIEEWKDLLANNVRFVTDDTLNAFITHECNKVLDNDGNPSDYLANIYEDPETGEMMDTHMMWEFEAMFDQGLNYEDGLLRFLAFVNPMDPSNDHVDQFCPNGIDDSTNKALFRLCQENGKLAEGYDYGVLQMRVPHRLSDDKTAYMWDNVYIGMSFFGEEYSGFSRPNVDGASNFLDGMNTMSMYGKTLKKKWERDKARWATSDIGRLHGNGSYEKVPEGQES